MFSGIIESVGRVRIVEPGESDVRLVLDTTLADLDLGESVAVNGVCLTVTQTDASGIAAFFVSPETLHRTTLGRLGEGDRVNLERAVTPTTRLSGHMVQGHVDATATLASVAPQGDAWAMLLDVPRSLRRYCVEKGSIALDGISLTINAIGTSVVPDRFSLSLMIIPHTWEHTTLGQLAAGACLNVEVDVIAKYVEQLCQRPN
ncbi:riboflavin synthase [Lichenicoccus sp.]|uniref:riboflavin synthase n=1 Tax=Lichenicoccus sp. TaxID=2781899 RepID=UPI003D0EC3E1